ncbi:MAG: hypothetical protein EXR71_18205 [Myxococcales bacterium]|nr:hypothetical protein [Myxococcales bacterium]
MFRRLCLLPLGVLALVAMPATPLGAGGPAVARAVDESAALGDEVAALWLGFDTGAPVGPIGDRVDELVGAQPRALLATGSVSPDLGAAFDALVELRVRVRLAVTPLPAGRKGEFLASVLPGATFGDVVFGVPASVTVAQAILESGWGKSAPGFNLFGMKGQGPAGTSKRRVVEYQGGKLAHRHHSFRLYHSYAESLADHSRVLATAERYAAARLVAEDPDAYARALQGRYATDPRYSHKLADLAERYGLRRFDWVMPSARLVAAN